jgi:Sulfotransferase family
MEGPPLAGTTSSSASGWFATLASPPGGDVEKGLPRLRITDGLPKLTVVIDGRGTVAPQPDATRSEPHATSPRTRRRALPSRKPPPSGKSNTAFNHRFTSQAAQPINSMTISRLQFGAHRGGGVNRGSQPNFFVIGAARSGTTALADMLRQHPDVFVTQPKEPHFLAFANERVSFSGPGDDITVNRVSVTDPEDYLRLYQSSGRRAARGDASVSTLYYPEASLPNLQSYWPESRLIAILRSPCERAFSAFCYLRARGFEPCEDFVEALAREDERRQLGWHHMWHYVAMSRYARQLRPFFERVGPAQVKVLFYDQLCANPNSTAREVFSFLEVDPDVIVDVPRVNVSGSARSAAAQWVIQRVVRQPQLRALGRSVTSYRFREKVRRANLAQAGMPQVARANLDRVFRSEIEELRRLLKENYPQWSDGAGLPSWLEHGRTAAASMS